MCWVWLSWKDPETVGSWFLPLAQLLLHTCPRGRWVNRLHVSCLGWWGYHLGPQPLSRCRGSTGSGFPRSTESSRSRGWACRVHLLRLWHFSTAESTPLGSLERRRLKSKENWRCLINPSHFSELKRNITALLLGLSPSNYLNHTMGYGCKISVKQYFVNRYTIWFWKILDNKILYLHWIRLYRWTFNLHDLHKGVMYKCTIGFIPIFIRCFTDPLKFNPSNLKTKVYSHPKASCKSRAWII